MAVRDPSERVCLNFVATLTDRLTDAPTEHLTTARDLDRWLRAHGLAGERATAAHLLVAHELRESMHALVSAAVTLRSPEAADLRTVNDAARRAPSSHLLWRKGEFTAVGLQPPVDGLLGIIATDLMNLLTGPDRSRLRQCEAEGCSTPFLSHDGGRPRRWCSSATCGNRARVSAHRARARAGASE